jgi:hypothetical protein
MLQSFDHALDARAAKLNLPENARRTLEEQRHKLAAADLSGSEPAARQAVKEAIDWSFVDGFRRVMFVGSGLAAASAIMALVLIRPIKPIDAARKTTAT